MKLFKSLKKFIKANHILAILGLFVLLVAINQFSKRKSNVTDTMRGGKVPTPLTPAGVPEGPLWTGRHMPQFSRANRNPSPKRR